MNLETSIKCWIVIFIIHAYDPTTQFQTKKSIGDKNSVITKTTLNTYSGPHTLPNTPEHAQTFQKILCC